MVLASFLFRREMSFSCEKGLHKSDLQKTSWVLVTGAGGAFALTENILGVGSYLNS